ncbi:Na+/H+ antiporter NhaC family protein [Crateriforma conspicua]|uniref:Malate-2H(+)/Na(+)-lactate antiporter n=1 Tax=Crateriforma conspicua TaxID=2527996 RepID=A0A5C6FTU4_9PLAN|nr:Na+/H+ antiporter NhaC family protein [Crateriforma conspicua]TWU65766.1 Malate-2H(+)/Na(+)-lactate antiporter [Crateriforma conspicua]
MKNPSQPASTSTIGRWLHGAAFAPLAIVFCVVLSLIAGRVADENWIEQFTSQGGQDVQVSPDLIATADDLREKIQEEKTSSDSLLVTSPDDSTPAVRVTVGRHFGIWSILPAVITLAFCVTFREPLPALLLGILSGALVLQQYDLTDAVLLPGLASTRAAGITLLYLWLLGALLGVWSRTGAALAFAEWVCGKFVRGPRSAKLVAWVLGVLFFQGGTVSTVLVGTTVKPITDRNRISPEELSYVVDSTASPIASLIAFNAWPGYVQSLIAVPGVAYLATEADRIGFFFQCAPLSFYSIFAITGTFLLSIDKAPFLGKRFRAAIARARRQGNPVTTGGVHVSADTIEPMGFEGDPDNKIDPDYRANPWEFALPLLTLIGIAVGTGLYDSPKVRWAFAAALGVAIAAALVRGMKLPSLVEGVGDGLKSVTVVSVILVLAVVLGGITTELGGGLYLSTAIGENAPRILFPAILFVLTAVIAFATGTSFGTYAIAYPLTMPMAIAMSSGLPAESGQWFVMICFAAVLNGSVFGDQCSPISDTTILSSLVSDCDLMEHVRTQIVPACLAGVLAMIAWTIMTAITVG